jgi:hypothetical protein
MSGINSKIFSFCAILILCFSVCYGSPPQVDSSLGLAKAYVPENNIFFQDGHMLIVDGQNLLSVKTLHQDSLGVFYYYAPFYGKCPKGHPYNADGGCTGYKCPYN